MKNRKTKSAKTRSVLVITALVAVIGFTMAGCGDDDDDDNGKGGGGGTFTLTGIPAEYNGMYANTDPHSYGTGNVIYGAQTLTVGGPSTGYNLTTTNSPISNGSVQIPIWTSTDKDDIYKRYTGSHTFSLIRVNINTQPAGRPTADPTMVDFRNVAFSNGSATRTWAQQDE